MSEETTHQLREAAERLRGRALARMAGLTTVPGMEYSIRTAQRAEEAQQAAMVWCHQLGGLDPHKVANMTLAEFAEFCVKQTGMPEPPDIPRKVLAGLRHLGKKEK